MSLDALAIILLLAVAALIATGAIVGQSIGHGKFTFGASRRIQPRQKFDRRRNR
jgi:hypothetical protein